MTSKERQIQQQPLITTGFDATSTAADVVAGVDLSGRTALVTGTSSGIGLETALALTGAGAAVTMAVRDVAAGAVAADRISAATGRESSSWSSAERESSGGVLDPPPAILFGEPRRFLVTVGFLDEGPVLVVGGGDGQSKRDRPPSLVPPVMHNCPPRTGVGCIGCKEAAGRLCPSGRLPASHLDVAAGVCN